LILFSTVAEYQNQYNAEDGLLVCQKNLGIVPGRNKNVLE
jgi:hypothetical protein